MNLACQIFSWLNRQRRIGFVESRRVGKYKVDKPGETDIGKRCFYFQ